MRRLVGLELAPGLLQGAQEDFGAEGIVAGAHQVAPQQHAQAHAEAGEALGLLDVEGPADGGEGELGVHFLHRHQAQRQGRGRGRLDCGRQQRDLLAQGQLDTGRGQVHEGIGVVPQEVAGADAARRGLCVVAGAGHVEQHCRHAPDHLVQAVGDPSRRDDDELLQRRLLRAGGLADGRCVGGIHGLDVWTGIGHHCAIILPHGNRKRWLPA